jgi:hypothetical protein
VCTVSTSDKIKLLTIRTTNFEKILGDSSNSYSTEDAEVKGDDGKG